MSIEILQGDCREVLATMEPDSFDACVCDPPYHLTAGKNGGTGIASLNVNSPAGRARISTGFMGKAWDGGDVAFQPETWAAVYRVLKPGAHLLAFGSTRTYHRLACAIEDAGFEIRDTIMWLYGSGFPKSHDVSKAIDRAAGAEREVVGENPYNGRRPNAASFERSTDIGRRASACDITVPATEAARQWAGWGTALKPATEIVCVARRPLSESTVAANVLRHGTGALNIDASRVATDESERARLAEWHARYGDRDYAHNEILGQFAEKRVRPPHEQGRWPANCAHDGSPEVLAAFANFGERASTGEYRDPGPTGKLAGNLFRREAINKNWYANDTGTAARFFKSCQFEPGEIQYALTCLLCGDAFSTLGECQSVENAEQRSTTESTLTEHSVHDNAAGSGQHDLAAKSDGSLSYALDAEPSFRTSPATKPASARSSASTELLEKIAQAARSADSLCSSCATDIAQKLAALRRGHGPESQRCRGSISEPFEQILNRALALYAAGRESTDTILTTASLKQLLGSVSLAIGDTIRLENGGSSASTKFGPTRFAFHSKADQSERVGNHPTVKPIALMEWLVRMVTPANGRVLDPFAGTGSTLVACDRLGFDAVGIEQDAQTVADAHEKIRRMRARRLIGDTANAPRALPGQQEMAL